jgi:hypothetical protein
MIIPVFSIPKLRQHTTKSRQLRLRLLASTAPVLHQGRTGMEPLTIIYADSSLPPHWIPIKQQGTLKDIRVSDITSVEVEISPSKITPLWWKRSFGSQPLHLPSTSSLFGDSETFVVPTPQRVGIPQSWNITVKSVSPLDFFDFEGVYGYRVSGELVLVAVSSSIRPPWSGTAPSWEGYGRFEIRIDFTAFLDRET